MGSGESRQSSLLALTRTALWLTAYVVASLLGRIIIVQPHNVGLVWPASGISLVWLASSTRRSWRLDLALVSVATIVVLYLTDGGVYRSLFALTTVLQVVLAVWAIRRWLPQVWGGGGRVPISRLHEFGQVLLIVGVSAALAALLRIGLGLAFIPDEVFSLIFGRWGRNAAGMATIGVFGLLVGGALAEQHDGGRPAFPVPTRNDLLHTAGIVLVTAGIFVFGFWQNPDVPSTFLLTLTVVWAAVRFGPLVTAAHSLVTGAATVLMTIWGYGPIANISSPETRALLAQLFVVVLMVIGLAIALTRRQFFETIGSLEQSEANLALRANELDLVMSHLEDGVAIIEEGGRVVHTNTAMRTAFGSRPERPLVRLSEPGEDEGQAFHPDGRPLADAENPVHRALAGEAIDREEYHHIDAEGVARWLEVSAFPIPHATDGPSRAMVVLRDTTATTTHRESLVSFAGTVAHDLNNPLSVIDGWAEAMEEDFAHSDSADARMAAPMVKHIRSSVTQARAFISDLLAHTVARDQALDCELVSLPTLVKHIAGSRDRPRDGAEIMAGDLLDVWADRVLLRQVLDNLIGNAIKYVARDTVPHIVIEAEWVDDGWVRVMVHDNGIGVPPAQRERVFDSFHRAASDGYAGTGLGLAICKRIIQRHGGRIGITDNADGVGSCFEFTLPTSAAALQRATAPV